jgi:nanoRNase/pAp phosphatase (c-di-AMP/oligoRNAs hydrolase)
VDVAAVALALGGGGHKSAAGMRLDMDLTAARRHLAERLRQALDKEAA